MFAGFRPKPAATPEKAPTPDRAGAASGGKPDQARAIERYARASADIGRMRAQELPVLPHQESALRRAGEALDQVRPDAARDLASAFRRDPGLIGQAAEGKTGGAVRAMAEERRQREENGENPPSERPAKPQRAERPAKPERQLRSERPERQPKVERPPRQEKPERPARGERQPRPEKPERIEKNANPAETGENAAAEPREGAPRRRSRGGRRHRRPQNGENAPAPQNSAE